MDPYYNHMHTFGPVNQNAGVDNGGHQFYGTKNLGAVTVGSFSTGTLVAGGILALYVTPAIVNVLIQNKILGFNNRLSTKKMVGRAAAVGAVVGLPLATIVGGAVATSGGKIY